jgi:hypothetical protein
MRPLDDVMPVYEFSERHEIGVDAERETTDRALRELTLAELPAVRLLVRLRGLRRVRADRPLLEEMAKGATVVEDVAGEGVVLALNGQFWRLRGREDGGARAEAVVDFRAEPGRLTTETRVHVAEPAARRKFARYWRVIRPFSGLIRILVLRAAKRRAEANV